MTTKTARRLCSDEKSSFLPLSCTLCPRECGAQRALGKRGLCGADDRLLVARAALHFWEEPPLSTSRGSGAIFFSNCPLRCLYCQNFTISAGDVGASISIDRLAEICLELEAQGAININLVTPTHYAIQVREAISRARLKGLTLPIIWNTSGYETTRTIHENSEFVDVYLSDFKYASASLATCYSHAPDYPQVALAALAAMVDEVGTPVFDEVDGQMRLVRGVVVRHLMLPGALDDSKRVVRMIHEHFGRDVLLSLMNQYTPVLNCAAHEGNSQAKDVLRRYPELSLRVPDKDYECLLAYADDLGIEDYFWQVGGAAEESFIPSFDLFGV